MTFHSLATQESERAFEDDKYHSYTTAEEYYNAEIHDTSRSNE